MNKKILFLILLLAVIVAPVIALGQGTVGTGGSSQASTIADNIKKLTVTIGIAIVVIGWVIAGILYLTAAGDPGKIKTAKSAMVAAIIGTALVVIAEVGYDTIKGIVNSAINSGT